MNRSHHHPWRVYFAIILVVLLVITLLKYSFDASSRMTAKFTPLIQAAMQIEIEATKAHLWLEEIVSGDATEDQDVVRAHLEQAQEYAAVMLDGGEMFGRTVIPLVNPELRQAVKTVHGKLGHLQKMAQLRLQAGMPAGSQPDQLYDATFRDFLAQVKNVEDLLQGLIASNLRRFETSQAVVFGLSMVLAAFLAVVMKRYTDKNEQAVREISKINQLLKRDIEHRQAAETALRDSDQNYREIFDAVGDAIFVHDADTGQVVDANQSVLRMYSCTYEEALKASADDFSSGEPPYTHEDALRMIEKVLKTNAPAVFEWHARKMTGELFWVEVSLKTAIIKGEKRVLAMVRDISERKKMQQALEDSERQYRHLIENINDVIYSLDTNGIITYVSPVVESITAYRQSDVIGKPFAHFVYEEDLPLVEESYKQTLAGKMEPLEYRVVDKNGRVRWVLNSSRVVYRDGEVAGTHGIVTDITERKRTELALRESEELFRSVIEQSGEGIYLADVGGNYFLVNRQLCKMTGYTERELTQMNVRDLLPEGAKPVLFDAVLKEGRAVQEKLLRRKDHTLLESEVSGYVIQLDQRRIVLGLVRDITDRRRADRALRESEERYRRLVEYNPAAILVHQKGKIVYANATALKLIGARSADEVIGRTALDFVHPDFRAIVKRRMAAIYNNRSYGGQLEETFIRMDGTPVDVDVAGIPTTYNGKPAAQVVFWDISGRKRAERQLKQSEQDYRGLFENAHDAIIVIEPESEIILEANQRAGKMYGFPLSELIGMSLKKLSKDVTSGQEKIRKTLKKKVYHNIETVQFRKDGSEMHLEINAAVIEYQNRTAILCINRDVTDRKHAEQALKESEKNYRLLFNNAVDSIYIQDAQGRFIDVNRSAVRMYGYPKSWLIGRSPVDISAPGKNDLEKTFKLIQKAFRGKPQRFQFWGQRKNGEIFPKEVTLKRGGYFGQEVVIAFARDISEQKKNEDAIRALNRDLEQRVKERTTHLTAVNRELEAFSYSVSHDLRAPLRGINGFSQALLEDYSDKLDDTGKDYLARVRRASERMAVLIDDLLTLSRISRDDMSMEETNLSRLAREIAADLSQTDRDRRVRWKIQPDIIVMGDTRLLRVMLTNLLQNAWKFTSKKADATIEFGQRNIKGRKTYFVRDNGAGFDMEFADKLFGPFQRLHSQSEFEGTGVGLATVQRIVHRHNGQVWAEGKENHGATIYFHLGERTNEKQ